MWLPRFKKYLRVGEQFLKSNLEATPGQVRQQEVEPDRDADATGRGEGEEGGGRGEQNADPGRAGLGASEAAAEFVFDFKYLGFWFAGDGCKWRHVQIRMAMAISAFGRLNDFWRDKRLSKRLKLKVHSC